MKSPVLLLRAATPWRCCRSRSLPLFAQQVVRGPYLQQGTPDSVVVRWRTDVPTDSAVHFGPDAGQARQGGEDEMEDHRACHDPGRSHAVHEVSLRRRQRREDAARRTPSTHFVTSPPHGTRQPIRTWVVGDAGTASAKGNEGLQAKVRDAYYKFTGDRRTDVLADARRQRLQHRHRRASIRLPSSTSTSDMLKKSVVWPTLGNHDAGSAASITQSGAYYDMFTLPTLGQAGGLMSGTEAYYSFDYGNIHFICLDSEGTDRSVGGAMLTWLKNDLAATKQDWIISYWHHPPYTKGSHDSNTEKKLVEMRTNALPILEAGGADLNLTGHSHSYERSFLLDGHYGTQDTLTAKMKIDAGDGRPDGKGAYRKATLRQGSARRRGLCRRGQLRQGEPAEREIRQARLPRSFRDVRLARRGSARWCSTSTATGSTRRSSARPANGWITSRSSKART